MSELGQQLREARLQKGMSLDDVQEMTKIRKRYLEAIEAGDYKVLPGSFYVRAFIKTYAETVGLDPDQLLEGHEKDVEPVDQEPTMEPVVQKRSSNRSTSGRNVKWLPTLLMWIFPILILVVIYLYANQASKPDTKSVDSQKVTENKEDPSKKDPPADTQTGNANDPDSQQGDKGGGNTDQTDNQDQTQNQDQTSNQPDQGTETDTTDPGSQDNTQGSQDVTVTEDGKKGKDTIFKVSAPAGSSVQVEIKATGKSWLEVYQGQNSHGKKLSFGNTEAGQSFSFPLGSEGIYIKSGYSPATDITVGGQPVTDGKSTSRIKLILDDASDSNSTDNQSTNGQDDSADSNE